MGSKTNISTFQNAADQVSKKNSDNFISKSDADLFTSLVQPWPQDPAPKNSDWNNPSFIDTQQPSSWTNPTQLPSGKDPTQPPSWTNPQQQPINQIQSSLVTEAVVPGFSNSGTENKPSQSTFPSSSLDSVNASKPYTIQIDPTKWADGKQPDCRFKGRDGHKYHLFSGDGLDIQGKYASISENDDQGGIDMATIQADKDQIIFNRQGEAFFNDVALNEGSDFSFGEKKVNLDNKSLSIAANDSDNKINLNATTDGIKMALLGTFQNTSGLFAKMFADGWDYSIDDSDEYDLTL